MNHFPTASRSTAHGSTGGFSSAMANPLVNPLLNAVVTHFAPAPEAAAPLEVSWTEMISHRDYLVRFAQRKLLDPALAEDAVHDVFEAVMSGRASFEGRAALRSWLTAILKNKIVDIIRQRARYGSFGSFGSPDSLDREDDADAIEQIECAQARPDQLAEHRELLGQTLQRIATLPKGLREVMEFRVLQDESSEAVCERLHISEASLFVRLHRARKQLLN